MDPFPTSLLKDCIEFLVPSITHLVNASYFSGVFPSAFKHGHVTPVPKKKGLDPKAFKNYPSITNLLSFYPKLLKSVLCPKCTLMSFKTTYSPQHNRLHKRKDNSTETALLRITNH